MPAENDHSAVPKNPAPQVRPDPAALQAWVADLRTMLRYHQLLGMHTYPLTPDLQPSPPRAALASPAAAASPRQRPPLAAAAAAAKPAPVSAAGGKDQLALLTGDIESCTLCALAASRQGQMHGQGRIGAPLMVVGDYTRPEDGCRAALFGVEEDAMLWNMMRAIQLAPDQVYVSNALKCCPPVGWQPVPESPQCCLSYLRREIELIGPKVLLAMGEMAAHSLVGGSGSVFRLRGRFHGYRLGAEGVSGLRVMVTLHPRFLIANPDMKKAAWQDLLLIQRQLQQG